MHDPAAGWDSGISRHDAALALVERSRGRLTRLIGLVRLAQFQALVALPDSGIRRLGELRERRIGLPGRWSLEARVAALRGATAALECAGLSHRHVQWLDLAPQAAAPAVLGAGPAPPAFAAEMRALQRRDVDTVYVCGLAGADAARAAGARVLLDIGGHRDRWVRSVTALLEAVTVEASRLREDPQSLRQALAAAAAEGTLDEERLQELGALKHFLIRWGFLDGDVDLAAWADASIVAGTRSSAHQVEAAPRAHGRSLVLGRALALFQRPPDAP